MRVLRMNKNTFIAETMTQVIFLSLPAPASENAAESNSICVLSEVMHCFTCTPDGEGAAEGVTEAELD